MFATLWAPTVDFQSMLQRCRLEHKLLQGSSDAMLKLACLAEQQNTHKEQEKEKLFSCKLSRSWSQVAEVGIITLCELLQPNSSCQGWHFLKLSKTEAPQQQQQRLLSPL